MLQTIIYFLMLQSFQSLLTFQSVICFCNDSQCERAFKSLGLSCNQLAINEIAQALRVRQKRSSLTTLSRFISNDGFALVVKSELKPFNQNYRFKLSGDERKVQIRHNDFTVCGFTSSKMTGGKKVAKSMITIILSISINIGIYHDI